MKKYVKLIVGVAAFVLLLVGASGLYNNLSKEYKPESNLQTAPESNAAEQTPAGQTPAEQTPAEQTPAGTAEADAATAQNADGQDDAAQEEASAQVIDFTMENMAGEEVTLYSLVGKPLVLNFWASWCGPCKMEIPDFQDAYEKYEGEVEFVLVNMTDGMQETKEKAMKFIEAEGYTLPFYFDVNQEAAYSYGVYALPTTYFVDENGNVVAGAQGMLDAKSLETGISMIYKEGK